MKLFSQNDTISTFDTTRRFDSIINQYKYYERLNTEIKLIENKIIKSKYAFHHIVDGIIIKTDSVKIKRDNCIYDIIFYDELKRRYKTISCNNNQISSIEIKENNYREVYSFKFGTLEIKETFQKNSDGILYEKNERGNIKKYQFFLDSEKKREVSRKLLESKSFESIVKRDNTNVFVDFDWGIDFTKEKEKCNCLKE